MGLNLTYIERANAALRRNLTENTILYGQNVSYGSCLGGLTKGIKTPVINTPNCENALIGMGFGLMLSGVNAVYAAKQLDFILLGVDQLTNTWAVLKSRTLTAGFTIIATIVDTGTEGPQACFDRALSLGEVTGIPVRVCDSGDIDSAMLALAQPGVRIICLKQSLYHT